MKCGRFAVVPSRVIDDTRVTPHMQRVLVALCSYGNREGWCRVLHNTLGKRLGLDHTTIGGHLKALEDYGYLEVEHTGGANRYRIVMDDELDPQWDRTPDVAGEEPVSDTGPGGDSDTGPEPVHNTVLEHPSLTQEIARDTSTKSPMIAAYRDEFSLTPALPTRIRMAAIVTDLDLWKRVMTAWHDIGWSPRNVKGMLECYQEGRIPGAGGRRRAPEPPTTDWKSKIANDPYMKGRNADGTVRAQPPAGQEQPK